MDELFFYTGENVNSLATFLQLEKGEYELKQKSNELFDFCFEEVALTPNSLVYYDYDDDQYDFFILD
jgi:hypothetical protein